MMTMEELVKKCPIIESTKDRNRRTYTVKQIEKNLDRLLYKISVVRWYYDDSMIVNSGYRSPSYNESLKDRGYKPAKYSNHLYGLAVDIKDKDRKIWNFVNANMSLMEDLGFYFESKRDTPTWVHFQMVPPGSGKRIFGR